MLPEGVCDGEEATETCYSGLKKYSFHTNVDKTSCFLIYLDNGIYGLKQYALNLEEYDIAKQLRNKLN
ncbi:hypothetical protein R6Q59_012080 [Mikania micrantha]